MALKSPPIVVGIKHTRSAISETTEISAFTCNAIGLSVNVTTRKIAVKPISKIESAISFGLFCLFAPSMRLIIRSKKVSPGFLVILMVISSLKTSVPPVTELRSPPDSRMTGADSPVMALSSMLAMPLMTSPSLGITSPALTTTTSPTLRLSELTFLRLPSSLSLLALPLFLPERSALACALPLPSANASAKLAKSTVKKSHTKTQNSNPKRGMLPRLLSKIHIKPVINVPK